MITAGTLEESQCISLKQWSLTDRERPNTDLSHLKFGQANGRGLLRAPNEVFVHCSTVAGGLGHYNAWSCDILYVSKRLFVYPKRRTVDL